MMKPLSLLIDLQTRRVRGVWRLTVFVALMLLPYYAASLFAHSAPEPPAGAPAGPAAPAAPAVDAATIVFYLIQVVWALFVSWLCLRLLEGLPLRSLGIAPERGRARDVLLGLGVSLSMILAVVALQTAGGMRLSPSSGRLGGEVLSALLLFVVAAAYEEVLFRGYPLQTLLRSLPPMVPVLLFAGLFGAAHLANPNHTTVATINTALAGVWLSVAYLKTRNLWFPTSLHLGWNWTMGAVCGLPVSGLRLPSQSLMTVVETGPVWLTGGSYGPEGGVAATVVLVVATLAIWRSPWLGKRERGNSGNEDAEIADGKNVLFFFPCIPRLHFRCFRVLSSPSR